MKLVYFAWLRERLGTGEEEVELPADVTTTGQLVNWLSQRGEPFSNAFSHPGVVRVAVDQEHAEDPDTPITGAREIALFPPMTGG